jgi:hypothetical protein
MSLACLPGLRAYPRGSDLLTTTKIPLKPYYSMNMDHRHAQKPRNPASIQYSSTKDDFRMSACDARMGLQALSSDNVTCAIIRQMLLEAQFREKF